MRSERRARGSRGRGAVHQYVAAGAQVLQTNTFGANRYRLGTHNLQSELESINRAGVRIARHAGQGRVYVAGSIGPSGQLLKSVSGLALDELEAAFKEQAAILIDEGVDLLLLETFRQPEEIRRVLKGVHAALADAPSGKRVPVIASVSFDTFGTMADGTGPEDLGRMLVGEGADAIGVNCADGPAGVYEMVTRMLEAGKPVVAQPNAGLPRRIDGRFAYMATPDYFLVYARRMLKAGVKGVGGCCGTTAEHIKQVAAAARMLGASGSTEARGEIGLGEGGGMRAPEVDSTLPVAPGVSVIEFSEKSDLGKKLAEKKFVISVEVNPPAGLSLDKAIEGARSCSSRRRRRDQHRRRRARPPRAWATSCSAIASKKSSACPRSCTSPRATQRARPGRAPLGPRARHAQPRDRHR
jgi:methionine synthase I (cobalamin-dependent)